MKRFMYIDGIFSVFLGQYQNFKSGGNICIFTQYPNIKTLGEYMTYQEFKETTGEIDPKKLLGIRRLRITKKDLKTERKVIEINDNIKRSGIVSKWGSGE